MIEYNLTNESNNNTYTFNNFNDVIDKIIDDSNIKELEVTINDIKEKVINSILNKGYCTIKIKNMTFILIAHIDGMHSIYTNM